MTYLYNMFNIVKGTSNFRPDLCLIGGHDSNEDDVAVKVDDFIEILCKAVIQLLTSLYKKVAGNLNQHW